MTQHLVECTHLPSNHTSSVKVCFVKLLAGELTDECCHCGELLPVSPLLVTYKNPGPCTRLCDLLQVLGGCHALVTVELHRFEGASDVGITAVAQDGVFPALQRLTLCLDPVTCTLPVVKAMQAKRPGILLTRAPIALPDLDAGPGSVLLG